jgi:hypothetical protein
MDTHLIGRTLGGSIGEALDEAAPGFISHLAAVRQ